MRIAFVTGAALAILGSAAAVASSSPQASKPLFVRHWRTHLLVGERVYVFTGVNIYNANSDGSCWYPLKRGDALARSLSALQGQNRAIRAWFFQNMATKHGARDWTAFDHTLAVARAQGVKVVPVLANQWNSCDTAGYKSATWYVDGYKEPARGGTVSYRSWVAEIATRYKNDPTILSWELINEGQITNPDGTCAANAASIFKAWAADVSGVIKSVDPNHLVSVGTTGAANCGTRGREYLDLYSLPTIDLCDYHDYSSLNAMPGDRQNGLAARIAQCAELGKPLFVGESGIKSSAVGGADERAHAFRAKFAAQFAAGVSGELLWNWNLRGSSEGFDVGPGDPVLEVLGRYGVSPSR